MNQKALLVVSFGTSYHDTREKTINKLEEDLRAAFPDRVFYRAWTSKMIIRKLRQRDNIKIPTVTEAMEQMLRDGIRDVLIQPTHILGGVENDSMTKDAMAFASQFDSIVIGDPLLIRTDDFFQAIHAVMCEFAVAQDEALVLMGHGTTHATNTAYAAIDYMFKATGYPNVFMGTVEAYPDLDVLIQQLKKSNLKKVTLAPFMIVAGDHANHDMASSEEDSWKSTLEREGFQVTCQLRGLGELQSIRKIFVLHAQLACGQTS